MGDTMSDYDDDELPDLTDDEIEAAAAAFVDSIHLSAPVSADLEGETDEDGEPLPVARKTLTDEEIEAMTDDPTPEDLDAAIASRTPLMQALLNAKTEE